MKKPQSLEVRCPCCDALIVLDPDSGAILRFEKPPDKHARISLEEAFRSEKARKKEADARLQQAFGELEKKDEILEKRFQEALKKAKESPDEKPLHPFDKDLE